MPLTACPTCSYSLQGLHDPICPECGTPIPAAPPLPLSLPARLAIYAATVLATATLAYFQTFNANVPRPWAVFPLTVIYPAYACPPGLLILVILPLTTFSALICLPLLFKNPRIRWWSTLAPLATAASSALWFYFAHRYGFKYQSPTHTLICESASLLFAIVLAALYILNRRNPAFKTKIPFHALTTLWLASYALPYLGELP